MVEMKRENGVAVCRAAVPGGGWRWKRSAGLGVTGRVADRLGDGTTQVSAAEQSAAFGGPWCLRTKNELSQDEVKKHCIIGTVAAGKRSFSVSKDDHGIFERDPPFSIVRNRKHEKCMGCCGRTPSVCGNGKGVACPGSGDETAGSGRDGRKRLSKAKEQRVPVLCAGTEKRRIWLRVRRRRRRPENKEEATTERMACESGCWRNVGRGGWTMQSYPLVIII